MKGDKLGRRGGSGSQEQPRREITKGDRLGRHGGRGRQEREGRQGSSSQEQPNGDDEGMGDEAAAAAKSSPEGTS